MLRDRSNISNRTRAGALLSSNGGQRVCFFAFRLVSQSLSLFPCAQFSAGADPTVPGPAGGGGEGASSEVLLHRSGSVPQRASSVRTQEGLGAASS